MSTLALDTPRDFSNEIDPWFDELPVIASDIIYEGAAVGDNASGYMRPLVSGDQFCGFAAANVDNSSGSAGDKRVKIRRQGIAQLTVTGASALTDRGLHVYATDDNAFTLTPSGSLIGTVAKWITSTTCLVFFQAQQIAKPIRKRQVTKTADFTCTAADDGTEFNTIGAGGTVVATLPSPGTALIGWSAKFRNAAGQTLKVAGAAADALITFNDLDADDVSFAQASELIGGAFLITCVSATKFFVEIIAEETQTVAVTT